MRAQAADSQANGFTEVIEANAAVFISDTAIPRETKQALQVAVASLQDVPEHRKDWHPRSREKVLDIVHPSLWPLMYGRSRYLADGKVPLKECTEFAGRGDHVPVPTLDESSRYSSKHQWLPPEVELEANGDARIKSYINNLHPAGNESLYEAIEQVLTKAIPIWKMALRSTLFLFPEPRMPVVEDGGFNMDAARRAVEERKAAAKKLRAEASARGSPEAERSPESDVGLQSDSEDDEADLYKDKYIVVPEPGPFERRERVPKEDGALEFDRTFPGSSLQVIVKLANIHLTPDDPYYYGGSWHLEVGRYCWCFLRCCTNESFRAS